MSDLTIRPLLDAEREPFLALNNAAAPHVNELDPQALDDLLGQAAMALAALSDDRLAGGLLALGPGADYSSANYRWFSERFDDFLYVDRVVVDEGRRGEGIGSALYRALANLAPAGCPRILCEVNEHPPNPDSLAFHEGQGFRRLDSLDHPDTGKRVILMERPLPGSEP